MVGPPVYTFDVANDEVRPELVFQLTQLVSQVITQLTFCAHRCLHSILEIHHEGDGNQKKHHHETSHQIGHAEPMLSAVSSASGAEEPLEATQNRCPRSSRLRRAAAVRVESFPYSFAKRVAICPNAVAISFMTPSISFIII